MTILTSDSVSESSCLSFAFETDPDLRRFRKSLRSAQMSQKSHVLNDVNF